MAAAMPNHFKISNPLLALGGGESASAPSGESDPLENLQSHLPAKRVESLDELPPDIANMVALHRDEQRKK